MEDHAENRILVRRILMAEDFCVEEAASAREALQKIFQHTPDLILMDINMPDMDGYTLTAQIKAHPDFANLPVIALTANVMKGDRERSLQAGCDGYIQKPIDVDNLPQQIRRFLSNATGRKVTP